MQCPLLIFVVETGCVVDIAEAESVAVVVVVVGGGGGGGTAEAVAAVDEEDCPRVDTVDLQMNAHHWVAVD